MKSRVGAAAMLAVLVSGCASGMHSVASPPSLEAQRGAVRQALSRIEPELASALTAAEALPEGAARDAEVERLLARRKIVRLETLGPLADGGNAEAMFRMARELRDATTPEEIARWLQLATRAAEGGHPTAHDELVRWWWHQKGDGSIAAVQRHRTRALDHAAEAARLGNWHGLDRIAVYIAGDVHQYPASLPLAARVMRLCARGGRSECQERMAGAGSYDFGAAPEERYVWLVLLAAQQPGRFGGRTQTVRTSLRAEAVAVADQQAADWRPATWPQLADEWAQLRSEILAHGAGSVGVYGPCSTSTPWCRGGALKLDE